jgi:hypothetical protein
MGREKQFRGTSKAGSKCTICRSPDLHRITGLLASGTTQKQIAEMLGIRQQSVSKHVLRHVKPQMQQFDLTAPILDAVRRLNFRTMKVLDQAERSKDWGSALAAISQARQNLTMVSKLTGEWKTGQSPEPVEVTINYIDVPPRS